MSALPSWLFSPFLSIHTQLCFGSFRLAFPHHSLFNEWLLGCPRIWIQTSSWDTTCGTVGRLVSSVTVSLMSCCNNTSCTSGGDTGWCSWRVECIPVKRMCQLIVSISSDMGRSGVVVFDLLWICTDSRRAAEAVFDLRSTWTFTQQEDGWLAGRWAGGVGGVEQGELSLGVSSLLPARCNINVQSGAISRLADCMIRAVWVHEMGKVCVTEIEKVSVWSFCWQHKHYCRIIVCTRLQLMIIFIMNETVYYLSINRSVFLLSEESENAITVAPSPK